MPTLPRTIRFAIALLSVAVATFSLSIPKIHKLQTSNGPAVVETLHATLEDNEVRTRRPPRLPRSKPEHWRS